MYRIYRITSIATLLLRPIKQNFSAQAVKNVRLHNHAYNINEKCINRVLNKTKLAAYGTILTWLGFTEDDEKKDSELIMTIKRSILCMQQNELLKAEQLLHVALKLAQEQQNPQGILYIYDLMANVALERGDAPKAEILFVEVLQRLLADGIEQDHLKVIHISLKLARIYQMKKESEKADAGFKWCLEKVKKHLSPDNRDAQMLNGVIHDWYAHYLLEKGLVNDSIKNLKEALKICIELQGTNSEKSILLLNDLGTATWQIGDLESAKDYFLEAIMLGRKLQDFEYLGVIYANLGLVCLQQGLFLEAQRYCKEGLAIGRKAKNEEALEQTAYCFEQIKLKSKSV